MQTITLSLPASEHLSEFELRMLLAGQLYERGRLSLGQAATVAGLSKRAFIEVMGKYGFSLFGSDPEEALMDFRNA